MRGPGKKLTAEQVDMLVGLLPDAKSLRDIAAIMGVSLQTVRTTAAPFLLLMKLNGTHPICGCGKDRFHRYGCPISLSGRRDPEATVAQLEKRRTIVSLIMEGASYGSIEVMLGMCRKSARRYLKYLTPEQRERRRRMDWETPNPRHGGIRQRGQTGRNLKRARLVSPEKTQLLTEMLTTHGCYADIAAHLGLNKTTVRRAAKPILEDMRAKGTHPVCECGQPRFHAGQCRAKLGRRRPEPRTRNATGRFIAASRAETSSVDHQWAMAA